MKHIPTAHYRLFIEKISPSSCWRVHPASMAANMVSKDYAIEAGRKAVAAHLERTDLSCRVVCFETPGVYMVECEHAFYCANISSIAVRTFFLYCSIVKIFSYTSVLALRPISIILSLFFIAKTMRLERAI